MSRLNYFKPINELSEDFEKLTIGQQQMETAMLLEIYLKHSREDFRLVGKNTSQTENIWRVYKHLKAITMSRIEVLVQRVSETKLPPLK